MATLPEGPLTLTEQKNFPHPEKSGIAPDHDAKMQGILVALVAFRDGDFSVRLPLDWTGTEGRIAEAFNQAIAQEDRISREVTRLSITVGKEGRLKQRLSMPIGVGGWAAKIQSVNTLIDDLVVKGVSGVWKDLTESVNQMAGNLTAQVRNIADVTIAVANGDLSKKITVDVRGEILQLKEAINTMVDQLNGFAAEVTRVAREVGVEGRLGGQASVPGAAGTWRDLTDNVNLLAGNLTTQVRAIAEVATAVTKGDLTRSIQVETRGEVAELKDNINTMIANLRETTERNKEQDWLKTNVAPFTSMLQGQRDLVTAGFDEHLVKPFDIIVIQKLLDDHLAR